ncbi:MAG: histidine--tRNA ligase [Treponema sp.]|jgi:histidyl-tRNA synthetase|nr:histidine--tRNA ligase [Treponema sp.]
MPYIEAKVLKGFRDFLPKQEMARRDLIARIEAVFRLYGLVPIDTPALEYAAILLGKSGGETEKQMYRFTDNGGRDVALRFDLTVPFARFLAEHSADIILPFKRYHIAKVWRGENTQRGRYREFTQCDFDIVGADNPAADFEILLILRDSVQATGAGAVTIKINHRGLFNHFLDHTGIDRTKTADILRIIDKASKIDRDSLRTQLEATVGKKHSDSLLSFIELKGPFADILPALIDCSGGLSPEASWLDQLYQYMRDTGTEDCFTLDPSITRGLDYYTGTVFETFLVAAPELGSICSGGRYDNLVALYSKESLSGVGASIGLDRLMVALEEKQSSYAMCALVCERAEDWGKAHATAQQLRNAGISCDVFLDIKKLTKQYVRAEKKAIPFVLLYRESLTLRDIQNRRNYEHITVEEIITTLKGV